MNRILELRQRHAKLVEDMTAFPALASKEGRAMTAEENEKFEKMFSDSKEIRREVTNLENLEQLTRENAASQEQQEQARAANGGQPTPEQRYGTAFERHMRFGYQSLNAEDRSILETGFRPGEQRGTSPQAVVGTTTAGGYVVPTGFRSDMVEAMKWFGGIRNTRAEVIRTDSGNPINWPMIDDTASVGAQIDENVADVVGDVAFGQATLNAYVYTSKMILLSLEFIQDEAVNFQGVLTRLLGNRLGRAMNLKGTVGTGSGQPQGVVVGSTQGKVGTTGQTLTVTYPDLVDLIYSVDKAYRQAGEFMFNDSVEKALLKLVDSYGRPLFWNDSGSLEAGRPTRLLGYPYVVNNDMAVMAANAKSILFGDFSAFKIREVMDVTMMRLVERYAEYRQVAFVAFMRFDSRLIDAGTHPIKHYANSAT